MSVSGKSKVWDYFEVQSDGGLVILVACKICHLAVSQGSSAGKKKNTSNLWSHLQNNHEEEHNKIRSREGPSKRPAQSAGLQPSWAEVMNKFRKWHGNDSKTKAVDNRVAR